MLKFLRIIFIIETTYVKENEISLEYSKNFLFQKVIP
jgi:hypothetical protein